LPYSPPSRSQNSTPAEKGLAHRASCLMSNLGNALNQWDRKKRQCKGIIETLRIPRSQRDRADSGA
jgi:hypothetical protein